MGGIQALVTVELNAWLNYCVIAYDYSPAVFQLGMSNTPLLAYTVDFTSVAILAYPLPYRNCIHGVIIMNY